MKKKTHQSSDISTCRSDVATWLRDSLAVAVTSRRERVTLGVSLGCIVAHF